MLQIPFNTDVYIFFVCSVTNGTSVRLKKTVGTPSCSFLPEVKLSLLVCITHCLN